MWLWYVLYVKLLVNRSLCPCQTNWDVLVVQAGWVRRKGERCPGDTAPLNGGVMGLCDGRSIIYLLIDSHKVSLVPFASPPEWSSFNCWALCYEKLIFLTWEASSIRHRAGVATSVVWLCEQLGFLFWDTKRRASRFMFGIDILKLGPQLPREKTWAHESLSSVQVCFMGQCCWILLKPTTQMTMKC